jgi:hypothetical protein
MVTNNTTKGETDMGKIVVSENITLDGVVQDPTGEEGFRYGGWFAQIGDKDREGWAKVGFDEALGAEACWVGGATSGWQPGGHPERVSGRTD